MEDMESLVKTTLAELEKLFSTKSVVGEAMVVEGNTIVPLVSIGFGFAVGGGTGKGAKDKGEGSGALTGAAGGIKPIGAIVVDKDGVRIMQIKGTMASLADRVADIGTKVLDKREEKKQSKKEE